MKFQLVMRVQTSQGLEVYIKSNILDSYPKNDFVERVCVDTFDCVSYKVELIREKLNITWEDIFNARKLPSGTFLHCKNVAKDVGYSYFAFNDRVFHVNAINVEHHECLVEDL
jgi:hypothetical protein